MDILEKNISLDGFLNGLVQVYQNDKGYKSGVDSVLLASIVSAKRGFKVLDIGSGVGVVSLLLAKRLQGITVFGVEKMEYFHKLALENAKLNEFEESIFTPLNANILHDKPFDFQFDVVVSNPPYYNDNLSNMELRDVANVESDASMKDFINFAFKNLKNHGHFYIIQRSERLKELLDLLPPKHWGNIEVFPIYSYVENPAKRCIIKAKKLGKNITTMNYGIVMHNSDGSYTKKAIDILKNAKCFNSIES